MPAECCPGLQNARTGCPVQIESVEPEHRTCTNAPLLMMRRTMPTSPSAAARCKGCAPKRTSLTANLPSDSDWYAEAEPGRGLGGRSNSQPYAGLILPPLPQKCYKVLQRILTPI